ncbi:MAG TPA: TraR/DksA C4-type zinc finger protein [Thermoleophilaceae bacterium]|nr:TraR/DksA C4-type zinc finger protein [Thermoleophilaceae bacterium]
MADHDKQAVEARLDERAREIEQRREELKRTDEGLTEELADYDQHPADQGTETFEQELDETTLIILEEEMKRVEEARKALSEGRYGICVDCGKEIPAARLEAIPETIRCVEDQRTYEARLRQRGAPGASH